MNLSKCTTGEISEAIEHALNGDEMDVIVNELLASFEKGQNKTLCKLIVSYFEDDIVKDERHVITEEMQKLRAWIMEVNLYR